MLAGVGAISVLVSSRAPLNQSDEHTFPVPSLALPDSSRLEPVERLAKVAAIRLFVVRAQSAAPKFFLSNENAALLTDIWHQLDGLPLAIELAAARVAPRQLDAARDRRLVNVWRAGYISS